MALVASWHLTSQIVRFLFALDTSFLSGTTRCSRLILCVHCPSPRVNHFCFYWKMMLETEIWALGIFQVFLKCWPRRDTPLSYLGFTHEHLCQGCVCMEGLFARLHSGSQGQGHPMERGQGLVVDPPQPICLSWAQGPWNIWIYCLTGDRYPHPFFGAIVGTLRPADCSFFVSTLHPTEPFLFVTRFLCGVQKYNYKSQWENRFLGNKYLWGFRRTCHHCVFL